MLQFEELCIQAVDCKCTPVILRLLNLGIEKFATAYHECVLPCGVCDVKTGWSRVTAGAGSVTITLSAFLSLFRLTVQPMRVLFLLLAWWVTACMAGCSGLINTALEYLWPLHQ